MTLHPPVKQFVQRVGSPVLEEVETGPAESVQTSPRCTIWWFLLIVGGVGVSWLGFLSLQAIDAKTQAGDAKTLAAENKAVQSEQYKNILWRLDAIDKKMDKHLEDKK